MSEQPTLKVEDIADNMTYYKLNESFLLCSKCKQILQDPIQDGTDFMCRKCIPIWQDFIQTTPTNENVNNFLNRLEFRCKNCEGIYNYSTKPSEHAQCEKADYSVKIKDLKEKIKMLLKLHPQLAEENEGRFTLTKNQNFCEFHSHPLVLCNLGNEWNCEVCQEKKVKYYNCYYCSYCDYHLCKTCYDASNI